MGTLVNKNKINCYCYLLFGLFFIIFLTIYSYGVFFLKNLGISYAHIGLIIGISALVASILQPLLGRAVDTYHFSWQKILIFLNIVIIIAVLAMFLLQNVWCSIMFSIMIIVSGVMYPFINYSPFYYENNGIIITLKSVNMNPITLAKIENDKEPKPRATPKLVSTP